MGLLKTNLQRIITQSIIKLILIVYLINFIFLPYVVDLLYMCIDLAV